MKKGTLRVALAGLVILSLLAACNKAKPADAASGALAEITVEVFDRGTDGGRSDPTNNNWTKWIQEKLLKDENIKVTFVAIPRTSETPSLNNMMAAGNAPDISYTYSQELIANYRELGGLFDMAPHIDSLMPDLKAFLGPDPSLPGRDLIYRTQDSKTRAVYSIPARRMITAQDSVFIRKDWLDKLGLPLPTTTQEFYDTLKAFKEKDPGGVGKNMVVPYAIGHGTGILLYSFIDPDLSRKDRWINTVNGASYLLPGYKEGYRFLNKLFNDGLLDPDFALQNQEAAMFNGLKSGIVGCYQADWDHAYRDSPGIYKDLKTNIPSAEIYAIDTFPNAKGVTAKYCYDIEGIHFIIPKTAKNPQAAMRYVNWLAREENLSFLQLGPEGIGHDVVDGIPRPKAATGLWIQNSGQNLDYTIPINGLELGTPEKNAKALALSYNVPAELIDRAHTIAMNNASPLPVIPVILTAAGPYQQTLADKGTSFTYQAIAAKPAEFDKIWDEGLADWLASGAQIIIDERRAKYIEP